MPPRLSSRPLEALAPQLRSLATRKHLCLLCSSSRASRTRGFRKLKAPRRTFATNPSEAQPTTSNPRAELEQALLELNKDAANYVNLSRLQLALLGLRQPAGEESIRVAVLSVANGNKGSTAKEVLGLLLGDPLRGEEGWEVVLRGHDVGQPLAVKIGKEGGGSGVIERKSMLREVRVSSAVYDGYNLEILLMQVNLSSGKMTKAAAEDALLDLPVDIASNTARFSPIMTPVHKALVVADGIMGVPSVTSLPPNDDEGLIHSVVNIPGYQPPNGSLPFQPIDVAPAREGLTLFRQSLDNAIPYERLWSQSNISALSAWLKTGIQPQAGSTKPAVRKLVASVLQNTLAAAEAAREARAPVVGMETSGALQSGLIEWAEKAHRELQDELDKAFTGRRWRKLGWWKLFWRADDVGTLTSEMVSQKFLARAENELVFLAGRIQQSRQGSTELTYSQPLPSTSKTPTETPSKEPKPATHPLRADPWPHHISFTRKYLLQETIPALQALAQKLVVQSAGTFGMTTSLAALLYVSASVSSLYEAGAVAALGAVWSLHRLQKNWETAREFWEGEVREEGRKAVRAAEKSVADVLEGERKAIKETGAGDFEKVRALVEKATEALKRLK